MAERLNERSDRLERVLEMRILRGIGRLLHEVDEAVFPSNIYCLCCGSMIDRTRPYSLCDECIRKFHWIVGPACECCGKALPERLETADAEGVRRPRLCYNCMNERPLYTKGFSCLTYGLHERELMMDLKYAGRGYIARKCGDMMFDRIEVEIDGGTFSRGQSPIDIIVPVPIDEDRLRERGYNQSTFMARQLARRWREHVREAGSGEWAPILYEDLLYRTRKTRKLRSLTPAERALELEGAFGVRSRYRSKTEGARVMLIDDILTTSATANACTNALLDAGASEVFFLSWASGGNRKPSEL